MTFYLALQPNLLCSSKAYRKKTIKWAAGVSLCLDFRSSAWPRDVCFVTCSEQCRNLWSVLLPTAEVRKLKPFNDTFTSAWVWNWRQTDFFLYFIKNDISAADLHFDSFFSFCCFALLLCSTVIRWISMAALLCSILSVWVKMENFPSLCLLRLMLWSVDLHECHLETFSGCLMWQI